MKWLTWIIQLLCDHVWSDDMNTPYVWRKYSGWYEIGGFPERQARKCIKCEKYEER